MDKEKRNLNDLADDDTKTGFSLCISSKGKNSPVNISFKCRTNLGDHLNEMHIEDASNEQLCAICNVLDI